MSQTFFDAVKSRDIDQVKVLVQEDPSLLEAFDPDYFGGPALNIAVSRGQLDLMDTLLEAGADPDLKSDWWAGGFAALHTIPADLRDAIAPRLIEAGATVDAHAAAYLGDAERLQECLVADPEVVRERGGDGRMPLHFAATPEVVQLLVEAGADLEARDVDHESTPFMWAAPSFPEAAAALVERGAQSDIFGLSAMGDAEAVREQLTRHPDAGTWRVEAARFPTEGEDVMAIYLFTLGSDATPLHVAAQRNRPEVIRMLLAHGVDPQIRGAYDRATPLHLAAWEGAIEAAHALIHGGASLDVPSGPAHNNEPIGWAIVSGQPDVVKLLLAHGAKVAEHHVRDAANAVANPNQVVSRATLSDRREIKSMIDERLASGT